MAHAHPTDFPIDSYARLVGGNTIGRVVRQLYQKIELVTDDRLWQAYPSECEPVAEPVAESAEPVAEPVSATVAHETTDYDRMWQEATIAAHKATQARETAERAAAANFAALSESEKDSATVAAVYGSDLPQAAITAENVAAVARFDVTIDGLGYGYHLMIDAAATVARQYGVCGMRPIVRPIPTQDAYAVTVALLATIARDLTLSAVASCYSSADALATVAAACQEGYLYSSAELAESVAEIARLCVDDGADYGFVPLIGGNLRDVWLCVRDYRAPQLAEPVAEPATIPDTLAIPTCYVITQNVPGYSPESEPYAVDTLQEAIDAIKDESDRYLENGAEIAEPDSENPYSVEIAADGLSAVGSDSGKVYDLGIVWEATLYAGFSADAYNDGSAEL